MKTLLILSCLASAGSTLEQGLKREITLLMGEEDGLRRELERLQALRAARVGALQRDIASLEAKAIEAAARETAARAALAAAAPPAPVTVSADATESMREALGLLAVTASAATATGEPLVDQLGPAIDALEARTSLRRVETGFFAPDGSWRQGTVLSLGSIGVAVADGAADVAGPLLVVEDGTLQLPSATSPAATAAARALRDDPATPLWPLAFPGPDDDVDGAGVGPTASLGERLLQLGLGGIIAALALLGALAFAVWHALAAWGRHRAVVAVAGRLVGLVSAGETVAAAALARTVGGAAGRFLVAVVAVVGRATPEDEVAALSAEATAALQRPLLIVRGAFGVAAAVVVVVAIVAMEAALRRGAGDAVVDGLATGLLPLGALAAAAVPIVAAIVVGEVLVARSRELLEVTALRLLDAAPREP